MRKKEGRGGGVEGKRDRERGKREVRERVAREAKRERSASY